MAFEWPAVVIELRGQVRSEAKTRLFVRLLERLERAVTHAEGRDIAAWVDTMGPAQVIELHQLLDYGRLPTAGE